MSFGKVTKFEVDPVSKTISGELIDLDSSAKVPFQRQPEITDLTRQDVVNYTPKDGTATEMSLNLAVRLKDLQTATQEVKDAAESLIRAMAKDKNMTIVNAKKI
jgi:hypothetical protein